MSNKRLSVTFTALIWMGMALIIVGTVMTIFGIGSNVAAIEIAVLDIAELSANHVGLILIVIGAFLSGVVALRLPPDVRVFSEGERGLTERIAEKALIPSVAIGILALLLLIVSIIV